MGKSFIGFDENGIIKYAAFERLLRAMCPAACG